MIRRHGGRTHTLCMTLVLLGTLLAECGNSIPQQPRPAPVLAPANPNFIAVKDSKHLSTSGMADGHRMGLIPNPVDLSHAKGKHVSIESKMLMALPPPV